MEELQNKIKFVKRILNMQIKQENLAYQLRKSKTHRQYQPETGQMVIFKIGSNRRIDSFF